MSNKGVVRCPICQVPIELFVIADRPGDPKGFFGYHTTREVLCEEGAWYHFRQSDKSKLAFIRSKAK